jgi:hypothetical protein
MKTSELFDFIERRTGVEPDAVNRTTDPETGMVTLTIQYKPLVDGPVSQADTPESFTQIGEEAEKAIKMAEVEEGKQLDILKASLSELGDGEDQMREAKAQLQSIVDNAPPEAKGLLGPIHNMLNAMETMEASVETLRDEIKGEFGNESPR